MEPGEFWADFGKWIGTIVALAVIAGAIIVGGWQAGWWFTNQNTNRAYQQQQNGLNNQDTLRDTIEKDLSQLTHNDVDALKAKQAGNTALYGQDEIEAAALAGKLCQEGAGVNPAVQYPTDVQSWFTVNCTAGVVKPDSRYFLQGEGS